MHDCRSKNKKFLILYYFSFIKSVSVFQKVASPQSVTLLVVSVCAVLPVLQAEDAMSVSVATGTLAMDALNATAQLLALQLTLQVIVTR